MVMLINLSAHKWWYHNKFWNIREVQKGQGVNITEQQWRFEYIITRDTKVGATSDKMLTKQKLAIISVLHK